jgi:hypothetical protein
MLFSDLLSEVLGANTLAYWRRTGAWEAWSITRWWLLFGALSMFAPNRRLCRLMLFAPWITVLEILFLAGVWFVFDSVVPEPSTLFTGFGELSLWADAGQRIWLVRSLLPTMLAGTIFFRAIIGWRLRSALLAGIALAPVGLILSVVWTRLAIQFVFP